jgi:hypothetical protein
MDHPLETEDDDQCVVVIYNPSLQTAAIILHSAAAITN